MRIIIPVPAVLALVLAPFVFAGWLALRAIRLLRHAKTGTRMAGAAVLAGTYFFAVWFWGL